MSMWQPVSTDARRLCTNRWGMAKVRPWSRWNVSESCGLCLGISFIVHRSLSSKEGIFGGYSQGHPSKSDTRHLIKCNHVQVGIYVEGCSWYEFCRLSLLLMLLLPLIGPLNTPGKLRRRRSVVSACNGTLGEFSWP